jgi:hypothetical protein
MSKLHFKIKNGARIVAVTSYPADAEEGDIVLRSDFTPPRLVVHRNGVWTELHDSSYIDLDSTNDTATGSNASLSAIGNSPFIRLTNASLVSVDMIPAGNNGQIIVLANATGTLITLNTDTGATATNRIITGTLKPLKMKNGATVILMYDSVTQRWRTIGGGGGDESTTSDLLERLKDRLIDAPFEWAEPNIFLTDESTKIASATASYDIANGVYKYTGIGQNIVSTQSLDAEFLTEEKDVTSVELIAFWNSTAIDSNATYEVSRNGGVNWQTMSMSRVGLTTETFRGIYNFPQDVSYINLHEWPVANATAYRELDATTLQAIGQQFVVSASTAQVVQRPTLYINKVQSAGTLTGTVYVQLVKDNGSGLPSTNTLDIVAQAQVLCSSLAVGDNVVVLSWGTTAIKAGTYHYVISTDTNYKSSFSAGVRSVRAQVDSVAPIGAFGIDELNAGTWTPNAAQTLAFKIEGRPLDLRVRITSSASNVELKGYGILYGRQTQVVSGIKNREVQTFDGTVDNFNEFTLSNFLPDPDLLKVYHVETGQVYMRGLDGFYVEGHKVVFAVDTFDGLGTVTLVFDQPEGAAFDNSEQNAALLAANFLGSTDASIDRSQAGRGIFLRRSDGTLREITIDNNDQIAIYSV